MKDAKPRPRFLRYKDCEQILSLGHRLKSTGYKMYQDLPYGIVERKRKQMDTFKTVKRNKIPASFSKSQPGKLYMRGKLWPIGKPLDVFQLLTCFLPQNALTVACQNLINATKPYFTEHLFIYWFTLAAERALQIGYHSDSNKCAEKFVVSSPKRSSVRFQAEAICKALFKFICTCLKCTQCVCVFLVANV